MRTSPRIRLTLFAALLPFILATGIGLVLLWPDSSALPRLEGGPEEFVAAKVESVRRAPCEGSSDPIELPCKTMRARPLEGPDQGDVIEFEVVDEPNAPVIRTGDRVVLAHSPEALAPLSYTFSDHERRPVLLAAVLLFAGAVVALGRWRGVTALVGFAISIGVIIWFVLPAILSGRNPLAVAVVGGSLVMLGALYLAHGFNVGTTTAALGTFASLALTGILAFLFVQVGRFTGFSSEEALYLNIQASQINLKGLLLAGIIIGSLGVLDDVTITQASAVWELKAANPGYAFGRLFGSAMTIGKAHIASTVNTLLLAYAGAALPLLIVFTLVGTRVLDVVNSEIVAEEIIRTMVGSVGLVASVPITTALASLVASKSSPEP